MLTIEKNDNFDRICTPNYMFCTFNTEEGFLEAETIKDLEIIDDVKLSFKRAK